MYFQPKNLKSTIHCGCQEITSVFRVLGIYNFEPMRKTDVLEERRTSLEFFKYLDPSLLHTEAKIIIKSHLLFFFQVKTFKKYF